MFFKGLYSGVFKSWDCVVELMHPDPKDGILAGYLERETTLTISDSIETGSLVESGILRVVSLSTAKIMEIT